VPYLRNIYGRDNVIATDVREAPEMIAQALKPGGRVVIWSSGADKMFESRLSNSGFKVQALPVRKHATAKSTSYMIYIADKIVPPAPKVAAETERPVEGGGKS
jgi:hypothetical protein